jgi:two-component system, OmpR family, sensor histidine kinase BaeS
MKSRLLWKFLAIIIVVIGVALADVWIAIEYLAADYYKFLMDKYGIKSPEVLAAFTDAAHRYLAWANLAAMAIGVSLGYLLLRRVLSPLSKMTEVTEKIAEGDYTARVNISSRDELNRLGMSFNRMADSLQRTEQLRKMMVADIAHELRSPLTNMRGYLEALSDGVLPPTTKTFELLSEETLRLIRLSEDLLLLAKADAAKASLNQQNISLHELIGRTVDLLHSQFLTKEITVETRFSPEADQVFADGDKLAQVVRNLLQNAWQYTPRGGKVAISTELETNRIRVIFTNTRDGIVPEHLPFIFERFYRGEQSRSREHGGAGIGLAIVKELVEAHGGQVAAESSPDQIRIWFTLPV